MIGPDRLLLERIAEALERIATVMESFEVAPDPEVLCQHPVERREDFSSMGVQRWRCACGHSVGLEGLAV